MGWFVLGLQSGVLVVMVLVTLQDRRWRREEAARDEELQRIRDSVRKL